MNIVTKKANRFGRKMNFPIDGLVEISAEGIVEVSDECGNLMVKSGAGWEHTDAEATKEEPKKEESKVEEKKEEVKVEVEETPKEESSDSANMDNMSNAELKQVLKDAGVYTSKHGKMSKKKLIAEIQSLMS